MNANSKPNQKIAEFQKLLQSKGITESDPKLELLRSFFTKSEMSATWGRLKAAREGSGSMTIA
eukprot:15465857-Alexandrium_andersonii.AAC.1